jgi:hypothetical protein
MDRTFFGDVIEADPPRPTSPQQIETNRGTGRVGDCD